MTESKSAIASIGIWGSLIALIPVALEAVNQAAGTGQLGPNGMLIAAAVGGLLSLFGRIRATKKITTVLP